MSKKMLREELQSYLDQVYPGSQIDTEHTLGGAVYIRFELGAELRNGTKKRVSQAVDRALAIFEDAFPDADNEIFVLVYDYIEGDLFNGTANYIYDQFPKEAFVKFYNKDKRNPSESNILTKFVMKFNAIAP